MAPRSPMLATASNADRSTAKGGAAYVPACSG
jgi:hypothetical protein